MLSENTTLLTMDETCDEAVKQLSQKIRQAGLTPVCTFDLQVARQAQGACPCPHHGTEQCDCQLVVLLVYHAHTRPLTLVAHGHNGQTWFSLVDTPQQRAEPLLVDTVQRLAYSLTTAV